MLRCFPSCNEGQGWPRGAEGTSVLPQPVLPAPALILSQHRSRCAPHGAEGAGVGPGPPPWDRLVYQPQPPGRHHAAAPKPISSPKINFYTIIPEAVIITP